MKSIVTKWACGAAALLAAVFGTIPAAAAVTVKVEEKPAPESVAASIRSELDTKAIQVVSDQGPIMQFWFRKSLPLAKPAVSGEDVLKAIEPVTLLGVVEILAERKDYRDDQLAKGVYTMRAAMQPEDGNHLGTSVFPYFVLLIPVERDKELDGVADQKALEKLSMGEGDKGHPRNLNLQPVSNAEGEFPRLGGGEANSKLLEVNVTTKAKDADSAAAFAIVYEGHGEL